MSDLLNTNELKTIAQAITCSVGAVLDSTENARPKPHLLAEIGNNTAMVLMGEISAMMPFIDDELQANARSAIWAATDNEMKGLSRAGLIEAALNSLRRLIAMGDADDALAELERRLFALFLAARHLRRLPNECRHAHMLIEDKHGHICTRCGESVEQ